MLKVLIVTHSMTSFSLTEARGQISHVVSGEFERCVTRGSRQLYVPSQIVGCDAETATSLRHMVS
jgi:hypothetical protein